MNTVGNLLIDDVLPEDMRDHGVLDKKGLDKLLGEVARRYPEKYREISHQLSDIGWKAAQDTGGFSFGMRHLQRSPASKNITDTLQRQIQQIADDDTLDDKTRENKIIKLVGSQLQPIQAATYDDAIKSNNPLGQQVLSGARGNKTNLNSLLGADLLYTDHRDEVIPVPVLHSYAEGLKPWEYFGGSYGARKGVLDLKTSTADAGYFGKTLAQATHRLIVTDLDGPEPLKDNVRGMPTSVDDPDNEGALLAQDYGPYKRNTVISPKIQAHLKQLGRERILVRSPIAGGPENGGVYSRDVGVREHGNLPGRGEFPGMTASQSLSEPITQGMICLVEGTRVRMADWSTKVIEAVQAGEWVLGADVHGKTFPVQVLDRFNNGLRDCVVTKFKSNEDNTELAYLRSTLEHKVLADVGKERVVAPVGHNADNWRLPFAALRGPRTSKAKAKQKGRLIRIAQESIGQRMTYDLEVDHFDHLFVLANGLIVSNSSKHTGGIAGAGKSISGFPAINALVQIPAFYKGGATHSDVDGIVGRITAAAAGGHYVHVNGVEHYLQDGAALKVKVGDRVEAGDVLSEGLPNPSKVVEHKGIGEGRRYFVQAFKDSLKASGMPGHRRNIEMLSRGLINHVRLTKEMGDYVPDDIAPYHEIEVKYKPRKDAQDLSVANATGKYLEAPVLHYSIGSKIRPSVQKDLHDFGIKTIKVHNEPPPFEAEMVRGTDNLANDPDWMTRQYGSGLKGSFVKAVHRGGTSDEKGTSFVASLAKAVDFGRMPGALVHSSEPGWEVKTAESSGNRLGGAAKSSPLATGVNPAISSTGSTGSTGSTPQSTSIAPIGSGMGGSAGPIAGANTATTAAGPSLPPAAAPSPSPGSDTPQPSQPWQPRVVEPAQAQAQHSHKPWFGGYQGINNQGMSTLANAFLPYAKNMGPLGAATMLTGLNSGALGTLTGGEQSWRNIGQNESATTAPSPVIDPATTTSAPATAAVPAASPATAFAPTTAPTTATTTAPTTAPTTAATPVSVPASVTPTASSATPAAAQSSVASPEMQLRSATSKYNGTLFNADGGIRAELAQLPDVHQAVRQAITSWQTDRNNVKLEQTLSRIVNNNTMRLQGVSQPKGTKEWMDAQLAKTFGRYSPTVAAIFNPMSNLRLTGSAMTPIRQIDSVLGKVPGAIDTTAAIAGRLAGKTWQGVKAAPGVISRGLEAAPGVISRGLEAAPGVISRGLEAAPGMIAKAPAAIADAAGSTGASLLSKGVEAAKDLGRNLSRYDPLLNITAPVLGGVAEGMYRFSDAGGGVYGAARDVATDATFAKAHPLQYAFNILSPHSAVSWLNPAGLMAHGVNWGGAIGSGLSRANYQNSDNARMQSDMFGSDTAAKFEQDRLMQDPYNQPGTAEAQAARIKGIREQDPRLARTQQEAEGYVRINDPVRYDKLQKELQWHQANDPANVYTVNWRDQDEHGQSGKLQLVGSVADQQIYNQQAEKDFGAQLRERRYLRELNAPAGPNGVKDYLDIEERYPDSQWLHGESQPAQQ